MEQKADRKHLRIVKVIPFFHPATAFGGPTIQGHSVCQALASRGHDVRVVTTDLAIGDDLPRDRWLDRFGYRVWYGKTRWLHRRPPYYAPMLRRPLTEAVADADVVQLNVGLTLLNRLARKIAMGCGVPYVYTAEGALCPIRLQVKGLRKAVFLRLVERTILRDAAAVQALTVKEAADAAAQGASPGQIHVIPNGVNWGDQHAWPSRMAFRQRHAIGRDECVVLFLGRLQQIKGLDLLVKAFSQVKDDSKVKLVLAGPDQGMRATLEKEISQLGVSDRVLFTGIVPADDRMEAYRAADLFVHTSYSEGLPVAVLEALGFGLPVLITHECHVPEVATYEAGRVVNPDTAEVADALQELVSDTQLRHQMGANARRLAEEKFSLDRVVGQLEELYMTLAR